ncbi:DUF1579 family protein [Paeniglutamicibacter antarcticus]|uniref:DUF1579 family protein n=1 Tax=Arthrobacter terrae TaxID=2935737 RepID=A0A931CTI0_9MICC|nr:DUF1579 family protein [Arthrobacter terrae]MBG0741139.1 DUF1579 family protein [Arthrobacter terrae]
MTDLTPEGSFAITEPFIPTRHPSLKALQPLVGTWLLRGHLSGSDEVTITGRTTFSWLSGGFFLQQDAAINFMDTLIESREIIGYNAQSQALESSVYSNLAPDPWPYRWGIDGDVLTISVNYGPLDSTFKGNIRSFSGGWIPNPGADPTANVAYGIVSERTND